MMGMRSKPFSFSALMVAVLVLGWSSFFTAAPAAGQESGESTSYTTQQTDTTQSEAQPRPGAEEPSTDTSGAVSEPGASARDSSATTGVSDEERERIRQQVEQETPPVKTVYDVTDPAVVYDTLNEGVDAWLSTLDYPHDQWGNMTAPGYVAAYRPDFVPSSLMSFLIQYYKDSDEIALAMGKEAVEELSQQLEQEREEAIEEEVDRRIDELESQAAGEGAEGGDAATEGDTSEDVPDLGDGDQPPADDSAGDGEETTSAEPPVLQSISPQTVAIEENGAPLTINGTGFSSDSPDDYSVSFDPPDACEALTPSEVSEGRLTVQLPSSFVAHENIVVTVTCKGESSNSITIDAATPTITSVNDQSDNITLKLGESVTIKGYGFDDKNDSNNIIKISSNDWETEASNCYFDSNENVCVIMFDLPEEGLDPGDGYSLTVETNGVETSRVTVSIEGDQQDTGQDQQGDTSQDTGQDQQGDTAQ